MSSASTTSDGSEITPVLPAEFEPVLPELMPVDAGTEATTAEASTTKKSSKLKNALNTLMATVGVGSAALLGM